MTYITSGWFWILIYCRSWRVLMKRSYTMICWQYKGYMSFLWFKCYYLRLSHYILLVKLDLRKNFSILVETSRIVWIKCIFFRTNCVSTNKSSPEDTSSRRGCNWAILKVMCLVQIRIMIRIVYFHTNTFSMKKGCREFERV